MNFCTNQVVSECLTKRPVFSKLRETGNSRHGSVVVAIGVNAVCTTEVINGLEFWLAYHNLCMLRSIFSNLIESVFLACGNRQSLDVLFASGFLSVTSVANVDTVSASWYLALASCNILKSSYMTRSHRISFCTGIRQVDDSLDGMIVGSNSIPGTIQVRTYHKSCPDKCEALLVNIVWFSLSFVQVVRLTSYIVSTLIAHPANRRLFSWVFGHHRP